MYFNLDELLTSTENLEFLEEPFLKEEIDKVISNMPSDKSPGPDGFIRDFLKKIWPVIAQGVNDYRPISLLNSSLKLITKLLADRLQQIILKVIHQNQYSFIKSRSIQDFLAWAFEYLHLC